MNVAETENWCEELKAVKKNSIYAGNRTRVINLSRRALPLRHATTTACRSQAEDLHLIEGGPAGFGLSLDRAVLESTFVAKVDLPMATASVVGRCKVESKDILNPSFGAKNLVRNEESSNFHESEIYINLN